MSTLRPVAAPEPPEPPPVPWWSYARGGFWLAQASAAAAICLAIATNHYELLIWPMLLAVMHFTAWRR